MRPSCWLKVHGLFTVLARSIPGFHAALRIVGKSVSTVPAHFTNICERFRGLRKFLDIQINRRDAMDAEAVGGGALSASIASLRLTNFRQRPKTSFRPTSAVQSRFYSKVLIWFMEAARQSWIAGW